MRSANKEELHRWRTVVYHLHHALAALPVAKGRLLRGISLPTIDFNLYKPGTEITWSAFSSTSFNYKVAVYFAQAHCGRLLSPFSQFPMEEEIVLPPNTRLKVESLHEVELLATPQS
eukprot:TRINITY_DN84843_c0_g1_i1.p2 TRINITY_DN84843_c0_g1~~TRINITY_DN84843_c0_g1_i1.p2  ORF type:complete len:117 (-),score=10.33 TRINITY_DN84843_c0_g1_i1:58-408(-)